MYRESIKPPGKILGARSERTGLAKALEKSARMEGAVREMVRRREAERLRELPRSASRRTAPEQGGDHLGRRTGRDKRTLTYQQLHREVCRFANVLKRNKIRKGDRVIIYMPMIPEAAIAMLACARIGAVHSVVFGGFSADSIRDRIADCGAIAVITADGGYRRGAIVPLEEKRG